MPAFIFNIPCTSNAEPFFIVSANEVYESPFSIECENLIPLFSSNSGSYVKPNTPLPFLDGILPDVPNKIEPVLILEISFFLFVLVLYSFMKFTISSLARNAFTVVSASFNATCMVFKFSIPLCSAIAVLVCSVSPSNLAFTLGEPAICSGPLAALYNSILSMIFSYPPLSSLL